MFQRDFDSYVCDGDSITCTSADGFFCRATLHYDDDTTPPDKRQDGFWPSLDPKDAGYIGPKSKSTLARERKHMKHVMDSWLRDEWHYYGINVEVWREGVLLTGKWEHASWGIEGNWPSRDKRKNTNAYFREAANDLLIHALTAARAKLKALRLDTPLLA